MKKLSAILSLLVIACLFHQGVALADTGKKPTKTNFVPKNRKGGATVVSTSKKAVSVTTPAPAAPVMPVAPPPPPPPAPVAAPAAVPSPASSPAAK